MKKLNLLFLGILMIGVSSLFVSCDGTDLGTVDVVLSDISINIPFTVEKEEAPAEVARIAANDTTIDGFYKFSGKIEGLSIEDEMFSELKDKDYSSLEMEIQGVTIEFIPADTTVTGVIRNFVSGSNIQGEETEFAQYASQKDIESYSSINDDKELTAYVQEVFKMLQDGNLVDIYASGLTDIVPSESGEEGTIVITPIVKAKMKLVK